MGEEPELDREEQQFLRTLREHGRVIEADREDVPLPPGVTHVLVREAEARKPRLVERRKSFF